jgi:hypothetical protein
VDVGVHRAAPADRVAREQKEAAEAADLVELLRPVGAAHLDPVFLDQKRHEIAAIAFAVALDAADLVEKARQDAGIGVPHAGEGVGFVRLHVRLDQRLAVCRRPICACRPSRRGYRHRRKRRCRTKYMIWPMVEQAHFGTTR